MYVNELIDILEKFGLKVKMFADDAKMCLRISDDTDVAQLQRAVDALISWTNMWQLSISVHKCCVLNVGRVISNNTNGALLPAVEHTHDLGVVISSDLSRSLHVSVKRSSMLLSSTRPLFVTMQTYFCMHTCFV